jgi:hypothetical protein
MRCIRCGHEWRAPLWLVGLTICALLLAGASSVLGYQLWGERRGLRVSRVRADSLVDDWAARKCIPGPR